MLSVVPIRFNVPLLANITIQKLPHHLGGGSSREEGGVQSRNEGHLAPQCERVPRPEYGLLLVLLFYEGPPGLKSRWLSSRKLTIWL
jgi:hypothetical protein